MMQHAQPAIQ
jgi:hypothetical protein